MESTSDLINENTTVNTESNERSVSDLTSANTEKTKRSVSDLTSTNTESNKKSVSESGHAKNTGNFQVLVTIVTSYGATYNPNKTALKLPQLNTLATAAQTSLTDVITKKTAYNNAINARTIAFSDLKSLSTRLVNALTITDAVTEKINDAKGFNRKLQGRRSSPVQSTTDSDESTAATISSSQQSFDQQIQHFAGLISVLQSEPTYLPNETSLKIATLTAKQTDLIAKNNAAAVAMVNVSNSRIARNKILYNTDTGLVDIAIDVKNYIKSVYGATSPEYIQIKGMEFKNVK